LLSTIRYVPDPELAELELAELEPPEPADEEDVDGELDEPQAAARAAAASSIVTKPNRRLIRAIRPVSSGGVCSVASMCVIPLPQSSGG
jgi:hypothetical protein